MADRFDLINFSKSITTTLGGNTANVSIDTNTLFVDGTNNRVGIGTGTPDATRALTLDSSVNYGGIDFRVSGSTQARIQQEATGNLYIDSGITANTGSTILRTANGSERMRIAANGNIGIGNTAPAQALSIAGALRTTSVSTNYVQSNAVAITVNTSTPTAICNVTITTLGKPVLLLVSGDRNPLVDGNWHYGQFYRDSTAIGKLTIGQMSFASHNQPFAQCMIDTPAAGTYSYQFRVNFGQGSITYGETSDNQAPTIIAMELI